MRANYLFLIVVLFCGAVYGQAQQGSVEEAISPKLIAADNAVLDQLQRCQIVASKSSLTLRPIPPIKILMPIQELTLASV